MVVKPETERVIINFVSGDAPQLGREGDILE